VTETFLGGVGFNKKAAVEAHVVDLAAGLVSASLTWGGKADLDLYVYSPSDQLVAYAAAASRGGPECLEFEATEGGLFSFEVVAASGKANYTLTVTHF
jgi:hypothetical protein